MSAFHVLLVPGKGFQDLLAGGECGARPPVAWLPPPDWEMGSNWRFGYHTHVSAILPKSALVLVCEGKVQPLGVAQLAWSRGLAFNVAAAIAKALLTNDPKAAETIKQTLDRWGTLIRLDADRQVIE